jgi:hypothetical protein
LLEHLEESKGFDKKVLKLTRKMRVILDEPIEAGGQTPLDMRIRTRNGQELFR